MPVIEYIIKLFREPSLFFALITFLGKMLQKKSFSEALQSAFKAMVGGVILFRGVEIIVASVNPLTEAFTLLFRTPASKPLAQFTVFIAQYGTEIGGVMIIAFLLNLIVARYTRWKSVFLTVNFIFWFSMLFTALGIEFSIPPIPRMALSSLFTALYMIIPSNLIRPLVQKLSGEDNFTIGHTASIFCFLGAGVGKLINKPENSAEDIKMPSNLAFLKDPTILAGFSVTLIFTAVFAIDFFSQGALRKDVFKTEDFFAYSLMQGALFAAGMAVLLMGVRLIFTELIPAFYGLSQKWVPNAIPALDIPMVFPYGQTALILGFVTSLISSIAALFVFGFMGILPYALLPLVIACYFDVAPGAIFANKWGGVPAVIISSALGGVLLMGLCALSLPLIANTAGDFLQLYGGNDFSLWTLITAPAYKLLSFWIGL